MGRQTSGLHTQCRIHVNCGAARRATMRYCGMLRIKGGYHIISCCSHIQGKLYRHQCCLPPRSKSHFSCTVCKLTSSEDTQKLGTSCPTIFNTSEVPVERQYKLEVTYNSQEPFSNRDYRPSPTTIIAREKIYIPSLQ